jgi:5-methylcytosine-specific restriction enzyme A
MAVRPPRRCTMCPAIATHHGRCEQHQVKPWANASANTKALSGRQRHQLRAQALASDPKCAVCGATDIELLELDHITEIADGGAKLDPDNTWLLCITCHAIKTQAARKARAAKRRARRTRPRG